MRPTAPPPFARPRAHRALDDLEALLLLRVDVLAPRDPSVRGKLEVDRQQLVARIRRCLAERHFPRMNGASYCRSELTAPWGLTLPPMPGYMWFHMVTSGRMWLETGRRSGIGSSSGTSRSCRTGRARS